MRKLLAILSLTAALLAWHVEAHAACTTHTIVGDTIVVCMTCCTAGYCTTSCN